jgi:hypothetical protein
MELFLAPLSCVGDPSEAHHGKVSECDRSQLTDRLELAKALPYLTTKLLA